MIAVVKSYDDVPVGHAFKTQSGRWFQVQAGNRYPQIDFGNSIYYDGCQFGPIIEVRQEFPRLSENEPFRIVVPRGLSIANFVNKILPATNLIFQTDQGYRWRTQLQNYHIAFNFSFETTDPRYPMGLAQWTASSGRIWRHLVGESLAVKWDNDQIVLSVFHQMFDGTRIEKMSIKSGQ